MGKRKMNGSSYYLCEWTGLPMKNSNCFMPHWSLENKLTKKGSYCNWESVLAHATHIYEVDKQLEENEYKRIRDYVHSVVGTYVEDAPSFNQLTHFGGNLSATAYHEKCCVETGEVTVVRIDTTGAAQETMLDTKEGKVDFGWFQGPTNVLRTTRKGRSKDKELCIIYEPDCMEPNAAASALFKMQLKGDVLLMQSSKEPSFMPRERYTDFTLEDYEESFSRKRKRVEPTVEALGPDEFKAVNKEMQKKLHHHEQKDSMRALPPADLVKASKMPPTNGHMLAKLARHAIEGH